MVRFFSLWRAADCFEAGAFQGLSAIEAPVDRIPTGNSNQGAMNWADSDESPGRPSSFQELRSAKQGWVTERTRFAARWAA